MKQLCIRTAQDDFDAFRIGEVALKVGGEILTVTVSPVMEFDHVQGYQKPAASGRYHWIVWMLFDAAFDLNRLDRAIDAAFVPPPAPGDQP